MKAITSSTLQVQEDGGKSGEPDAVGAHYFEEQVLAQLYLMQDIVVSK